MKTSGIIIIIIGILLTIFTTVKFFTREKIIQIGSVEVTQEAPHELNWSHFAGLTIIGLGGVVLAYATRKV